jgi:hypothetical protein
VVKRRLSGGEQGTGAVTTQPYRKNRVKEQRSSGGGATVEWRGGGGEQGAGAVYG